MTLAPRFKNCYAVKSHVKLPESSRLRLAAAIDSHRELEKLSFNSHPSTLGDSRSCLAQPLTAVITSFTGRVCSDKWGRGGVVVSALDFRSKGRWFEAQSLPLCCLLRQETLSAGVPATYFWG